MKIPVLLPNIFNHPFTYITELKLKPGDYVSVPFGKTEMTGVIWDEFEKSENKNFVLKNILRNRNKIDIIDVCDAINNGYLDIPFSPHPQNLNKVKTYRDKYGMIRFSDYGKMPLTDKLKEKDLKVLKLNKNLLIDNNIIDAINFMVKK